MRNPGPSGSCTVQSEAGRPALDTGPGYCFTRLTDHMLGAGIIAGWNTNQNTAKKTHLDVP